MGGMKYRAQHYQQEQIENSAQEYQRVAYEVQTVADLATSSDARTLRIMLKRTSVSNSEDQCRKLLPSQLGHSKLSHTLELMNLRQI